MTASPSITLILTVRNRHELLARTLHSISTQAFTDFDLIIVDNGSTDAAPRILRRWIDEHGSRFNSVTLVQEPRPGAAIARNRGLSHATTDYVMFFDSDDEMLPDHLHHIHEFLIRNTHTQILRWDVGILNPDSWLEVKSHPGKCDLALQIIHSPLSTQRFIVSTKLLADVGGWNESLRIWIDWELGCRLIMSGAKVSYLTGEPTVHIHPSADSITGNSWAERAPHHEATLDMVKSAISSVHSPTSDTTTHLLLIDAKRAAAAGMYRREGHKAIARTTLKKACAGHNLKHRLALRCIYMTTRIWGHGLAALCAIFFPKKRVKE